MRTLIIAIIAIAASVQAAPITLTIIASDGSGPTFTNTVTIKGLYVPQDVATFADQQGVKPRNSIVRRAGVLAKVGLNEYFNTLPNIYNKRKTDEATTNIVKEVSGATTEGDE